MINSQKSRDLELARKLHQQEHCVGLTENAVIPNNRNKENYRPKTLIDQTLELIDPTPNIYTLFVQFNERFFWNVLLPVQVKWSPRMTSCAGVCSFHSRNRECIISLSTPLLKLRPRKDLVETLLHEMIHAYLFLTNNNRDRDGHGPEFCKHMNRINEIAGTKITIYHSFHDEVRLYQQHWWRCNGPCQKIGPFFGTVRRSMNRAPGPNDFWWKDHQQKCGGQFIKFKEPENFKAKKSKTKEKVTPVHKNDNSPNSLFNWLKKTSLINLTSTPKKTTIVNDQSNSNGLKKLGNATNNVHGWGTGGPKSLNNLQNSSPHNTKPATTPKFSSFGILGGFNLGQSNLLDKFNNDLQNQSPCKSPMSSARVLNSPIDTNTKRSIVNNDRTLSNKLVKCPVCNIFVLSNEIDAHVDSCLITSESKNRSGEIIAKTCNSFVESEAKISDTNTKRSIANNDRTLSNKLVKCPICNIFVLNNEIDAHVDFCLITSESTNRSGEIIAKKNNNFVESEAKISDSSFGQKRKGTYSTNPNKQPKLDELHGLKKTHCPICQKRFDLISINEHLDKCLSEADVENDNNLVITLDSSSSSDDSGPSTRNLKNPAKEFQGNTLITKTAHNCLVCNKLIPANTSLDEHLEDCIKSVFKDDFTLPVDCNNDKTLEVVSEVSENNQTDKYPCPVCMKLITESLMNQHLDECLAKT